jgi:plasmid maintenance system antidote protein VapI
MKKQPAPITDLLRETIIASKLPLLTLQEETGVKRASIMRFIRGEQSLRLDIADKLAALRRFSTAAGGHAHLRGTLQDPVV